jgi:hypothetical protein
MPTKKGPTKAERWGIQLDNACKRYGLAPASYRKLCTLSVRLGRWAEEEANGTIQRAEATPTFPNGRPHRWQEWKPGYYRDCGPIVDKEFLDLATARRLVAKVPGLGLYHQDDCRGVALYIYRLADLRPGDQIDCVYSSIGHACYREV